MTVHEFIEHGWSPPHPEDRIEGLVQVSDFVVIVTTSRLWKAVSDQYNDFTVYLIGHL